ncbi:hypothetical protein N177_1623 [Lutibaculum baratangense AMV1]|uniref:Uncharacterized protein n=1 Tax=Lutibaculum baratangense AMV1 TaxID=631454 RepID=V4RHB5_9HYPH|nr:hypothetical protein N177_1623 [Lutibaculum baratangense AMV1]
MLRGEDRRSPAPCEAGWEEPGSPVSVQSRLQRSAEARVLL